MERLIRKTTAEQVADRIEVAILAGEFEPGGRLPPEHKLAAMLGVGRGTLREGIQRLIARGILIAVPGMGTFVANTTLTRSIETLPSIYLFEKVAARKAELLKQYFDYRRSVAAEVLGLVCARCTPEQVSWVEDSLIRMSNHAFTDKDPEAALEEELRLLQIAAERSDAYVVWLNLNTMRTFLSVAKKELASIACLDELHARAREFLRLLKLRDAKGVREYVEGTMEKEDYRWLKAFEQKIREPALTEAAAPAPTIPLQSSTGSSTAAPAQPTTGTMTRMLAGPPPVTHAPPPPEKVANEVVAAPPEPPQTKDGWTPDPEKYPRTDPRAWYPYYIDWCQRNMLCNPWDIPDNDPPGSPSPYDEFVNATVRAAKRTES